MSEKKEYNWLEDPFDEEKQLSDLQKAKASRNIGCLIAAIVLIVAIIALCVLGCSALGLLTTYN